LINNEDGAFVVRASTAGSPNGGIVVGAYGEDEDADKHRKTPSSDARTCHPNLGCSGRSRNMRIRCSNPPIIIHGNHLEGISNSYKLYLEKIFRTEIGYSQPIT
jgi:hypothetical protein